MKLINCYQTFLDIELAKQYPDCKMLTSTFILKNIYTAVIENRQTGNVYLIVDNMKKTDQICIDLRVFPGIGEYVISNIYRLKNALPEKIYKYLLNNGLFQTSNEGRNYNANIAVHRLVCCLHMNITGKQIDHADNNPKNNRYDNLYPVSERYNQELQQVDTEIHKFSIKVLKGLDDNRKKRKHTRQTLQSNDTCT